MKAPFIALLLTSMSIGCYAQKIFGLSRYKMKDTLTKYGYEFVQSKVENDGTPYDSFIGDNGILENCYYNKSGYCYQFMQLMLKKNLIDRVESLDREYIKVDDKNWISKNNNVKAWIYISENDWFYVLYEYIQLKDS